MWSWSIWKYGTSVLSIFVMFCDSVFILFWDGNLILCNASGKMFSVRLRHSNPSLLPLYVLFKFSKFNLEKPRSLSIQVHCDLKNWSKEIKSWFHAGAIDSKQNFRVSGCSNSVLYRLNPWNPQKCCKTCKSQNANNQVLLI